MGFPDENLQDSRCIKELENVDLDLIDYTDLETKKTDSFVEIINKGRIMKLRKTTLCWMLETKDSRLSSDRLQRVRGPKSFIDKNIPTKSKKKQDISESESSESESEETLKYDDSDDTETFSEFEDDASKNVSSTAHFQLEQYYAVAYHDSWYIGRILETNTVQSKLKFLKFDLDRYIWPPREDIQVVQNTYIFEGPLKLSGTYPFTLTRAIKSRIDKKYKTMKKS